MFLAGASREFQSRSSVSTTIHAPEHTSNFAPVSASLLRKLDKHFPSEQDCRSVPGERQSASKPQAQSTQQVVPTRWRARQLLRKSTQIRRAPSGGVAVKNDQLSVLLHDQSTALGRFVFVTVVDVNSTRAKHDLVTVSLNHRSCLLDKCAVEQLATRVGQCNPNRTLRMGRVSLGLFTHWLHQSRARLQRSDHAAER